MEILLLFSFIFSITLLIRGLLQEGLVQEGRITIEMVPFEMHGYNVRSRLNDYQWKQICHVINKEANPSGNYKCVVCGENGRLQGFNHPVECHEVWDYDSFHRTQRLVGILSLCPMCHKVKHIGLADKQGYGGRAKQHIAKHNKWTMATVDKYIRQAKKNVKRKSGKRWVLDLTYLNQDKFSFLNEKFTNDEARNCNNRKVY